MNTTPCWDLLIYTEHGHCLGKCHSRLPVLLTSPCTSTSSYKVNHTLVVAWLQCPAPNLSNYSQGMSRHISCLILTVLVTQATQNNICIGAKSKVHIQNHTVTNLKQSVGIGVFLRLGILGWTLLAFRHRTCKCDNLNIKYIIKNFSVLQFIKNKKKSNHSALSYNLVKVYELIGNAILVVFRRSETNGAEEVTSIQNDIIYCILLCACKTEHGG